MKRLLLLALVLICPLAYGAPNEIAPEKRKAIEKMLRLTGMEKLTGQMKTQMITSLKAGSPSMPEAFWTKFEQKMDVKVLIEKIIPIYDKYYSIDDLKAVNAFYESPAGQKVLSVMPQVMQESMQIGREWGEQIGRQAAQEAKEELDKKEEKKGK
jgi:hypothetical protein